MMSLTNGRRSGATWSRGRRRPSQRTCPPWRSECLRSSPCRMPPLPSPAPRLPAQRRAAVRGMTLLRLGRRVARRRRRGASCGSRVRGPRCQRGARAGPTRGPPRRMRAAQVRAPPRGWGVAWGHRRVSSRVVRPPVVVRPRPRPRRPRRRGTRAAQRVGRVASQVPAIGPRTPLRPLRQRRGRTTGPPRGGWAAARRAHPRPRRRPLWRLPVLLPRRTARGARAARRPLLRWRARGAMNRRRGWASGARTRRTGGCQRARRRRAPTAAHQALTAGEGLGPVQGVAVPGVAAAVGRARQWGRRHREAQRGRWRCVAQ